MDDRLGKYHADGSIDKYPITDIYGSRYNKPPTTLTLPNNHFCVTPAGLADEALIGELRKLCGGQSKKMKVPRFKETTEE